MLVPIKKKRFVAGLICLCLFLQTGGYVRAAEAGNQKILTNEAEATESTVDGKELETESLEDAEEEETKPTSQPGEEAENSGEEENEPLSQPEEEAENSGEEEHEPVSQPGEEAGNSGEEETKPVSQPGEEAENSGEEENEPISQSEEETENLGEEETKSASRPGEEAGTLEEKEKVSQAAQELERLAQEKDILAIVYLTDAYAVKAEAKKEAETVASLPSAHTVQVLGMEAEWIWDEAGEKYFPKIWYRIQFYRGEKLDSGYMEESYLAYSDERLLQWREQYGSIFKNNGINSSAANGSYSDVERFPASYQVYLKKLKTTHPNWTFVPMKVNRDWEECVREQLGSYSWIYYNQPEEYRGEQINSTWYYASYEGIAHYMDPRNFLTERNIFQFEQNTYNASYHTQEALQSFLNNTFMAGAMPGDSEGRTYAYTIWLSGSDRGLSPFNLAARVIQEQGTKGNSPMISGTYAGFEGYYNYYNIGASGTTNAEVLKNGLTYAKKAGWNTRFKALYEGAGFIGNNYILKGQDTLYLQKFDVEKSRGYLHQYMQNIMAPYTEGRSMQSMYVEAGSLNSAFVFKIPVFNNMPGPNYSLEPSSLSLEKGETADLRLKSNGITIEEPEKIAQFSSDDPAVAQVSARGRVTAVGSGETLIRVRIQSDGQEIELTARVKVRTSLKGISLNQSRVELYVIDEDIQQIAFLNEKGVTEYKDKAECSTQALLQVLYDPADTTDDRTVKWIVEDENVVRVEPDKNDGSRAIVHAREGGTTRITAQVGKFTAAVEVAVRVPMSQASVNKNTLSLYQGQSERIMVKYSPYTTTDRVEPEWYSDNETVVTIQNGEILAVGEGTALVHAKMGPFDGSQSELTCEVTVRACQVTFKNEDGSDLLTAKGVYGKTLTLLKSDQGEIPWSQEKEGKYFLGWYTEENGKGEAVAQDTVLYADMTLYPCFAEEGKQFYVKPIGSLYYTGAWLKPEAEVYAGNRKLIKGVDYTLSYANNRDVSIGANKAGQPQVIVKGRGAYTETVVQTFTILPKTISHIDVLVSNLLTSYTGKIQKVKPDIRDSKRILQLNKDYLLEYPDMDKGAYKEAGTYEIRIIGKGNYNGSRTVYLTISKRILISRVTVEKIADMTYAAGEECRPELSLSWQGKKLEENRDYSVAFLNNQNIGKATVILIGKGNYIGSRSLNYEIVGCDIHTLKLSGIEDREYTGSPIEQNGLRLMDKEGRELTLNKDYGVTYRNNREAGRATIVIEGKGGYQGRITRTFRILPYNIEENSLTWQPASGGEEIPAFSLEDTKIEVVYDKDGARPQVEVSFKGQTLVSGKDYSLSWMNNKQVGSTGQENPPSITVTGKGNFTGKVTKSFTILTKDIALVSITAKDVKFRNRTGYCFAEPILKDESGRKLKAGVDYEEELIYTYETDVVLQDGTLRRAGETVQKSDIPTPQKEKEARIRVTVQGIGNYNKTTSATYAILENSSWVTTIIDTVSQSLFASAPPQEDRPEEEDTVEKKEESAEKESVLQDSSYSTPVYPVEDNEDKEVGEVKEVEKVEEVKGKENREEPKTSYEATVSRNTPDKQIIGKAILEAFWQSIRKTRSVGIPVNW